MSYCTNSNNIEKNDIPKTQKAQIAVLTPSEDKDFIVRISPTVMDNNSVYSISQFDGKQISLPNNPKNYPSTESLIWHTKEIFQI